MKKQVASNPKKSASFSTENNGGYRNVNDHQMIFCHRVSGETTGV
jgi:hypothetical protein